jgi:hypothetical protein
MRYELEADGVLRDKPGAPFKNRVYAAAAGVLCYRRIELVSGEAAWEAALEKAQLLTWAKAAAAAGGLRKDLGPGELAELALKMAMERLEAKAKTKRAVATLGNV